MVDTLKPYDDKLKSIKNELPLALRKALIKERDRVLKILKEEQLSEGIDSEGKVVGKYSYLSQQYAEEERKASGGLFPKQDKIAGQPFNFEWTGDLFSQVYLFFEDLDSYSLFSADEKAAYLQATYGDIFTLTTENNELINKEILLPELNTYLQRQLTF